MQGAQRVIWRAAEALKRHARPLRDRVVARYPASARYLVRRPAMQSLRWQRLFWTDPDRPIAPLPYTEASVATVLQEVGSLSPFDKVLEVGSGLGAVLAALVDRGVTNVTGVEINPLAVERMREMHPALAEIDMLIGPAEEVLAELPDNSFSVIVAVRTLRHTHPDSAHLFATLARLAPTVVTIDEPYLGRHAFPWELDREFGKHGMQVATRRPLFVDGEPTSSTVLVMKRRVASSRRRTRRGRRGGRTRGVAQQPAAS